MKIYLDFVGCRLNQSELETYARQFQRAGHVLVHSPLEADLAVINTCTVTGAAESDSRQRLRQVHRAGARSIVVTGCWSTLAPGAAASMPGVSLLVDNQEKDQLVSQVLHQQEGEGAVALHHQDSIIAPRLRTRAFIKVQDGCNNRCSYCITALARGPSRSRTIHNILGDIKHLTQVDTNQVQEVVLTGVHLGSWGRDFTPPLDLKHLVKVILDACDVPRLRLSSLEPWDIGEDFFLLWQDARLCPQLHLPLQSGSASVLKRMRRKTTPSDFARLVAAARLAIPDVAISTDVMVGFPGESGQEFTESLEFIQQMHFSLGHVFTYSARPGTDAAEMENQVPHALRKERGQAIHRVLQRSSQEYRQSMIGRVFPVLWESSTPAVDQGWYLSGLTANYIRVKALSSEKLWNQITHVRLVELEGEGMSGEIEESDCKEKR